MPGAVASRGAVPKAGAWASYKPAPNSLANMVAFQRPVLYCERWPEEHWEIHRPSAIILPTGSTVTVELGAARPGEHETTGRRPRPRGAPAESKASGGRRWERPGPPRAPVPPPP